MPERHRPFADHPCAANSHQLIAQARLFLALAIGDTTRQTYESGVKSYLTFVEQHNIAPAFPASLATICLWLSQSASPPHGLRVGTCKLYLAAVITRHTELGFHKFTFAVGKNSDRSPSLRQLTLHRGDDSILDTLTATTSSGAQYATLHLDASKTDPFRTGVDIMIASPTAVQAIVRYVGHLRTQRPRPTQASPLFVTSDVTAVKRSWLIIEVSRLLRLAGHDPDRYSSHSFRKGGAVSLQERGVEDSLIRRSGRWKSDAFHGYLRHATIGTVIAANARLD